MPVDKPIHYQGTGRPGKLTPQLQEKICKLISEGNYLVTACQAVGIDKSTYLRWIERGQEEANNGGGVYKDFIVAVKKAEAEQEAVMVQRLIDGAMPGQRKKVTKIDADGNETQEITETGGDWTAAATFLERRHPDRYGRRDSSKIVIDETKKITITRVEVVKDYGQGVEIVESTARELPPSQEEDRMIESGN